MSQLVRDQKLLGQEENGVVVIAEAVGVLMPRGGVDLVVLADAPRDSADRNYMTAWNFMR